jgi:hypothetical protein
MAGQKMAAEMSSEALVVTRVGDIFFLHEIV